MGAARSGPRREQRQVDAGEVGCLDILDGEIGTVPLERASRRPRRGQQAEVRDGECALGKYGTHHPADETTRTDDGNVQHVAQVTGVVFGPRWGSWLCVP